LQAGDANSPASGLEAFSRRCTELLRLRVFALNPEVDDDVLVGPGGAGVTRPKNLLEDRKHFPVDRLRRSIFSLLLKVAAQTPVRCRSKRMLFAHTLPQDLYPGAEKGFGLAILCLLIQSNRQVDRGERGVRVLVVQDSAEDREPMLQRYFGLRVPS